MRDGAEALKKIAAARAPFVDFYGPGSRELTHKLWQRAGLKPEGDWVLKDESPTPQEIVAFAEKKQAYVVVGRIPVTNGKMALGKMEVLVQGDPEMRRPYVVIEANPKKFPKVNAEGAHALADWLTGEKGQAFLLDYGRRTGIPLYYPVNIPDEPAKIARSVLEQLAQPLPRWQRRRLARRTQRRYIPPAPCARSPSPVSRRPAGRRATAPRSVRERACSSHAPARAPSR